MSFQSSKTNTKARRGTNEGKHMNLSDDSFVDITLEGEERFVDSWRWQTYTQAGPRRKHWAGQDIPGA